MIFKYKGLDLVKNTHPSMTLLINPLCPTATNSSRIAKISILKSKESSKKQFPMSVATMSW